MCPHFRVSKKSCDMDKSCSTECFACVNMKMCQSKIYEACPLYIRSLFAKNDCIAV